MPAAQYPLENLRIPFSGKPTMDSAEIGLPPIA